MPMASTEFQSLTDPEQLLKTFVPTGERYTIAARISGKAVTAYPEGVDVETVPDCPETVPEGLKLKWKVKGK